MNQILKQISIFLAVTFCLTLTLWYSTHLPIWLLVMTSITSQYLGNNILQNILNVHYGIKNKKLETEMLAQLSFQAVSIECPCHKKVKQDILLRLNEDTVYTCKTCGKQLGVVTDITATLLTQPVNTTIEGFDKLLKEAKNVATDTIKPT